MDIERIGTSGAPSPAEKKGRKSTPDSEEFREMVKTGEAEFEKPKKRKFQQQEKTSGLPEAPPKTKPTQPPPFKQPKINLPKEEPEIQPPSRTQKEPETQEPEKPEDKEKKTEKKEKKDQEVTVYKEEMKAEMLPPKEKKEKIEKAKKTEGKIFIKEEPLAKDIKKEEKPKITPPKAEEKLIAPKEKKFEREEEKGKKKEKEEYRHEVSSVIQEMPPNIAHKTEMLTSPLTPYLHPDIVPLFEKMVGSIIQIQSQGITRTEVVLNSPAFTSSIFFGSSISLEKYSTAPDSFNIFLRGPQQAVVMFNENLDGLLDTFKRGKFNFRIGRLEAEHERPIFRRKEKPKDTDNETG